MTKKLHQISKGKTTQLRGQDIVDVVSNFPNMGYHNFNKLNRAYIKGCGCRIKLEDDEMVGSGFLSKANKIGKQMGRVALKSGLANVLIDETMGALPIPQTAQNVASRIAKNQLKDYAGAGIMKKMGKIGKNVGKTVMKSGVGDMIIDEALNNSGLKNSKYKNAVGDIAKMGARDLTGGGNPYLPSKLNGGGLEKYGVPMRTYSDSSNMVRYDTDSFKPSVYNMPLYSTPVAQQLIRGNGFRVYA